ncbi:transposase [Sorangium cellulosum]|uniref:Transposase n=1 Tax=Sorangium cellulosum TaxID=56 RepID=A0A2L0EVN3_SORCE|nr:transposase [Sorangium cellulosum]AUX43357.1 transposase [Sorangium cellulosum]
MSQPREIVPGATYLITRRVVRRHLLFRPDAAINQLLVYVLAVSARRYGVQIHALCAMSTHLHLVVTDAQGVLPRFLQFFHRIVALGTKVLRKWEGAVWDHETTSVVRLLTHAAVVEKIAYVLANPVAAGLVRRAREWPGVKVDVDEIGRGALRAARPSAYFNPKNPQWSEEVTLQLALPPAVEQHDADGFRGQVASELGRLEAQARAEVDRQGGRFLGAERASKISPYQRATSFEALRERNPTFAVGRQQGGAWRTAAAAVRAFRASYHVALEQWCSGVRSAVFPAGTWWMRTFHGASVNDVVHAT